MITLSRVVKPETVVRNGRVYIEDDVDSVVVRFGDPDGYTVSMAFDGRFDQTDYHGGEVRQVHPLYADCPVIPRGNGCPIRQLRDALNTLLEDSDDCFVTALCAMFPGLADGETDVNGADLVDWITDYLK